MESHDPRGAVPEPAADPRSGVLPAAVGSHPAPFGARVTIDPVAVRAGVVELVDDLQDRVDAPRLRRPKRGPSRFPRPPRCTASSRPGPRGRAGRSRTGARGRQEEGRRLGEGQRGQIDGLPIPDRPWIPTRRSRRTWPPVGGGTVGRRVLDLHVEDDVGGGEGDGPHQLGEVGDRRDGKVPAGGGSGRRCGKRDPRQRGVGSARPARPGIRRPRGCRPPDPEIPAGRGAPAPAAAWCCGSCRRDPPPGARSRPTGSRLRPAGGPTLPSSASPWQVAH